MEGIFETFLVILLIMLISKGIYKLLIIGVLALITSCTKDEDFYLAHFKELVLNDTVFLGRYYDVDTKYCITFDKDTIKIYYDNVLIDKDFQKNSFINAHVTDNMCSIQYDKKRILYVRNNKYITPNWTICKIYPDHIELYNREEIVKIIPENVNE